MNTDNTKKRGKLFVYSGCSGVGKGTIMKELVKSDSNIRLSVSLTTRSPRPGEVEGVDYYYVTHDEFNKTIAEDGFLEHEEYCGNYYGTPKKAVEEMLSQGINVFLEIEVKGGVNVINKFPECISIFVLPPSLEELERRLRGRGTESDEIISERMATAVEELKSAPLYKHQVVNDDINVAIKEILDIVNNA